MYKWTIINNDYPCDIVPKYVRFESTLAFFTSQYYTDNYNNQYEQSGYIHMHCVC